MAFFTSITNTNGINNTATTTNLVTKAKADSLLSTGAEGILL